jgi:hypothetical protein
MEGGARAQASLAHTLEVMSARVVPAAALSLTLAWSSLDAESRLADPAQVAAVRSALAALAAAGAAS